MADTDTAVILADLQDQLDDLTATVTAQQQQIERLLPLLDRTAGDGSAP